MSVNKIAIHESQPDNGVVLWWSNILQSYRLHVRRDGEVVQSDSDSDHDALQLRAMDKAQALSLDVYEIDVPKLSFTTDAL